MCANYQLVANKIIFTNNKCSILTAFLIACLVIVVVASSNTVRELMIAAHDMNLDNGDYVFINFELFAK